MTAGRGRMGKLLKLWLLELQEDLLQEQLEDLLLQLVLRQLWELQVLRVLALQGRVLLPHARVCTREQLLQEAGLPPVSLQELEDPEGVLLSLS